MALEHHSSIPASERGEGAAMRLVAERLAAKGVEVRVPDRADGRRLTIINARRARSEITVEDCGYVMWDYWPWSGPRSDPSEIAGLVLCLLGASPGGSLRCTMLQAHLKLKGIVGRELAAHGLRVALEVFEDLGAYDVAAGIAVTNPARPGRGTAHVTDDGMVTWEYRSSAGSETGTIVDAIASVLTRGIGGCRSYSSDSVQSGSRAVG